MDVMFFFGVINWNNVHFPCRKQRIAILIRQSGLKPSYKDTPQLLRIRLYTKLETLLIEQFQKPLPGSRIAVVWSCGQK